MGQLGLRDLFIDQPSYDPGYTHDASANTPEQIFSPGSTGKSRIDYMFIRNMNRHGDSLHSNSVSVRQDFKFTTSEGNVDLSDHYPLVGVFDLK